MTLTLTNLSTGHTLTVEGVHPTSDDVIALQTLEGLGIRYALQPGNAYERYGLTSGKRINPMTPFGEQLMNLGSMLAKDVIKGE